ncbi:MAG: DUF2085 domain-containing protein [Chloroflexota bacterium]
MSSTPGVARSSDRRAVGRLQSRAYLALLLLAFGLWLSLVPSGLLGKADAIAYAVCHRIDLRSFHLGDRALPLCARCTGMYCGALLSLFYYAGRGRNRSASFPRWPLLIPLGLFAAAWAVDGLNSYLQLLPGLPYLYPASNPLRLVTGTLMGLTLGTLVYTGFNQTAWHEAIPEPALRSASDLGLLLLLAGLVDGGVLSENPLLLYPLALVSSFGVLLLLTLIYAMVLMMLLRRENAGHVWADLLSPLAGGATLAIAQIAALDWARLALTGTWAGFSL